MVKIREEQTEAEINTVDSVAGKTGVVTLVAADVTDFEAAVSANTNVAANTAKVTNATHTGDVTGATSLTIADDAVTYAKMQDISATDRLLGRAPAGVGIVEEITCTAFARSILDDADAATVRGTIGIDQVVQATDSVTLETAASELLAKFENAEVTPVNNLVFQTAATTDEPTITVEGTDTNIGIILTPKGDAAVGITKQLAVINTRDIENTAAFIATGAGNTSATVGIITTNSSAAALSITGGNGILMTTGSATFTLGDLTLLATSAAVNIGGDKIIGERGAAVADASGGATVDTEARAAINALLAELRATGGHGLIAD